MESYRKAFAEPRYERIAETFRWQIPDHFNIADAVCGRHARGADGLALIDIDLSGTAHPWRFSELDRRSNRLANALRAHGVGRQDRVGLIMGQRVDTLLIHLALYKLGAIAVPLFRLFGGDALRFRLADCGAVALLADDGSFQIADGLRSELPELKLLWNVDHEGYARLLDQASDQLRPVVTRTDDPALIIYTSGTTGSPKGALHAHRVLLGHLPGVQMPHERFPKADDRFWTPADWAWIGGLLDVLLPSLYFGVPVIAQAPQKFDPEAALSMLAAHDARNLFMPPTALRKLKEVDPVPPAGLRLRTIGSGGEPLGDDLVGWIRDRLGVTVNEFYGQTEANLLVSGMAGCFERTPGRIGRAVPGRRIGIVGPDARALAPGEEGEIAVQRPDPVMFLRYWNQPEATAAKFAGDWLLTGDQGVMDERGAVRFLGRADDIINSAGYRIGPAEVEAAVADHDQVAAVCAFGLSDAVRGQVVALAVVPRPGVAADDALAERLAARGVARVGAHARPRHIRWLDSLPTTATGKVRRRELQDA
ncbi:MAG: AMP-binding protein [Geminicoccaceae bacterium]